MLISVLLVDDHGVLRDGLRDLLNLHADIRVVAEAKTGEEAIAFATQHAPSVAIVDISMPGLTGIEATRRILEAAPATAVLMLSYHSEPELVRESFRAGARGFVLKASAATEVVKAVRIVAAGRRYVGIGLSDALIESLSAGMKGRGIIDQLTPREREILRLVADGKSSARIAASLGLSPRTIETYRQRLMEKLGVRDIPSLVKFAIRHGISPME